MAEGKVTLQDVLDAYRHHHDNDGSDDTWLIMLVKLIDPAPVPEEEEPEGEEAVAEPTGDETTESATE